MGKQSVFEKSKAHQTAVVQFRVNGEDFGSLGQAQIYNFSSDFALDFSAPGILNISLAGGGIPALTDGHIFVGNASNVATDVLMTGDASIVASGAVSLTAQALMQVHSRIDVLMSKVSLLQTAPDDLRTYLISQAFGN